MATETKQQCPICGFKYLVSEIPICPTCALDSARHILETSGIESPFGKFKAPAPSDLSAELRSIRIRFLIGQGGMGAVYLGRHEELDRDVAVKLLPIAEIRDPRVLERFDREARILASFQHPNIVSVIDSGRTESYAYIVMEYVDGCSLRELICSTPFSVSESLATIASICSAVEEAHHAGVIHRDIKPDNVLVDADGELKLIDFGIAQAQQEFTLTATNETIGTVAYLSPEAKRTGDALDERSDIHSLGTMLYELIAGKTPPSIYKPPCSDRPINGIILKCLQDDPADRYQSVRDLRLRIEQVRKQKSRPIYGRHRAFVATLITVSAVATLIVLNWTTLFPTPSATRSSPPALNATGLVLLPQDFGCGNSNGPAAGDLDNDGDIDLVFGNALDYGDRVWLNGGSNAFNEIANPGIGAESESCLLLHVDGDEKLDLVCTGQRALFSVYYGLGDGTFRDGPRDDTSGAVGAIASADFDNDGDPDVVLAVGKWGEKTGVYIYRNESGILTQSETLDAVVTAYDVDVADLDGNGFADIFVGTSYAPDQVWLNDGSAFQLTDQKFKPSDTQACALSDLDSDGDTDAIACPMRRAPEIWLNDGNGRFHLAPKQPLRAASHPTCAVHVDVDGDAHLDLFIGQFHQFPYLVYLNDGSAGFHAAKEVPQSYGFAIDCTQADVDGDGRDDILITNANSHPNVVLLNRPHD